MQNQTPTVTTSPALSAVASVEITSTVPGNDWETGKHDVAKPGTRPKIVDRGLTHYVNIRNAAGRVVLQNMRYQAGSGATYANGKLAPLDAAEVISAYLSEADLGADTFDDFCSNLGYDTDSRKALDSYLDCQNIHLRFTRGFTQAALETLHTLTEEI